MINHNNGKNSFNYRFSMASGCVGDDRGIKDEGGKQSWLWETGLVVIIPMTDRLSIMLYF